VSVTERIQPSTAHEASAALAEASARGQIVRFRGGGTKASWGAAGAEPSLEISSGALNRIVEHNEGDLTAVLEAGASLAEAQALFASAGQMLALDPPLGDGGRATIGGIVATGDSGPLRHRYGGVRDLVIGMTVALSDGTIAHSGGKVIKNVAGYDLAKLFCGSFGTLGMILAVNLRLHPTPPATMTALGGSHDPAKLRSAAIALARAPLELDALDVAWSAGRGELLARASGARPAARSERAADLMRDAELEQVQIASEDEQLWRRQRDRQRSTSAALVRVAARPSALAEVLELSERLGAGVVGRAALGTSYVDCEPGAVAELRRALPAGAAAVVLDGQVELDPWGPLEAPALELMRRIKHRFDPAGACNPGVFAGGI
jgi:glycolate oxidase FAD binding subunit